MHNTYTHSLTHTLGWRMKSEKANAQFTRKKQQNSRDDDGDDDDGGSGGGGGGGDDGGSGNGDSEMEAAEAAPIQMRTNFMLCSNPNGNRVVV